MNKKVLIAEMTWPEIADLLAAGLDTVIVPIGSVEQHGPHLPIGTDSYVAQTLAEHVAELAECVVAPPIWCGFSPHHMVLPGTITIRPEILIEYVYDLIESLATHGFQNFVLLNGHRIVNIMWMQIAAERMKRQLNVNVVVADPAYLSKEIVVDLGFGKVGHADAIESSHMWHRYPELVQMEKAIDFPLVDSSLYHVDPANGQDTLCYVPSSYAEAASHLPDSMGVAGCPTASDPAKGARYHQHIVDNLVTVINRLKVADPR